jgi:archaellum component FlaF (FlaF/FlaG flagellin family)
MGMSTVASSLIMFIGVLVVSTAMISVFNGYVEKTSDAIIEQQDMITNQLRTSIEIEVISYNNDTNITTAYIENTGSTILKIENIDLFTDGTRIPRDTSNRTIEVLSDTDTVNVGKWDPKESIKVQINKSLEENKTYKFIITTDYNGLDMEEFSA